MKLQKSVGSEDWIAPNPRGAGAWVPCSSRNPRVGSGSWPEPTRGFREGNDTHAWVPAPRRNPRVSSGTLTEPTRVGSGTPPEPTRVGSGTYKHNDTMMLMIMLLMMLMIMLLVMLMIMLLMIILALITRLSF